MCSRAMERSARKERSAPASGANSSAFRVQLPARRRRPRPDRVGGDAGHQVRSPLRSLSSRRPRLLSRRRLKPAQRIDLRRVAGGEGADPRARTRTANPHRQLLSAQLRWKLHSPPPNLSLPRLPTHCGESSSASAGPKGTGGAGPSRGAHPGMEPSQCRVALGNDKVVVGQSPTTPATLALFRLVVRETPGIR